MQWRLIQFFLIYFVLSSSAAAQGSEGVSISFVSSQRYTFIQMRDQSVCNIVISGGIEQPDSLRLLDLIERQFEVPAPDELGWVACLDSSGGNFAEGIRLGEVLSRFGFATRVRSGQECLSACAVAFLFGTLHLWDDGLNLRILDRGGRIGWHAPSLNFDGETSHEFALRRIYSNALIDVATLIDVAGGVFRTQHEEVLPRELLRNMLAVGSESFYFLETVGQLLRYDIILSGVGLRFSRELSQVESWRRWVCFNALIALRLISPEDEEYFRSTAWGTGIHHLGVPPPPQGWVDFHVDDFWANACHIRYHDAENYFQVNIYSGRNSVDSTSLQIFGLLPPSTRISDPPR